VSVPDSKGAVEAASRSEPAAGIVCAAVGVDIIELAALRERTQVLKALAARRGLSFPGCGRSLTARDILVLCVRPERWLLLTPPAAPAAALANWQGAAAGCAIAVELSSALTALHLSGPAVIEGLARGCRLDLHPEVFAPGSVAATHMAQVPVILAALAGGWLLLTPSTTARHLREWLATSGAPFGFASSADVTVATVFGERTQ
jgi:heterotetrameric sarcosine oxidase gamma subunit